MSRFTRLPFVKSIGTAYHKRDEKVLESLTTEQWATVLPLIHQGISHGRSFALEEDYPTVVDFESPNLRRKAE